MSIKIYFGMSKWSTVMKTKYLNQQNRHFYNISAKPCIYLKYVKTILVKYCFIHNTRQTVQLS